MTRIRAMAILAVLSLATGCMTPGVLRPTPEGQVLYLGNDGILRDAWGNSEILVDRNGNQLHIDVGATAIQYQDLLRQP